MKSYARYALLTAIVLAFLYFVYPTRYIYLTTTTQLNPFQDALRPQFPVRVDRLTGRAEILHGTFGWYGAGGHSVSKTTE